MDAAEFTWAVPADHPAFAGHFPSRPIVPGVVLLDQAILFAQKMRGAADATGWRIAQAKFFVPIGPSQVLRFALHTTPRGAIAFAVTCDEREVAAGSLLPTPAP
nr:hypothetical protein [Hydrogenophaga sp. BPS33]